MVFSHGGGGVGGRGGGFVFSQVGGGVVIVGGFDGVENIVGIGGIHGFVGSRVDQFVGLGGGGGFAVADEGIAAHEEEQLGGEAEAAGLVRGLGVVPLGVGADHLADHMSPHAVAAGNLGGEGGQGHEGVHEIGVLLAPEPG